MDDLQNLTIKKALQFMSQGDITAEALINHFIDRMQKAKPLNLFVLEDLDNARELARNIDKQKKQPGYNSLPLEGIPVAIKDNFSTKGVLTTACSNILRSYTPTYESTVTDRLCNKKGAISLGKINMDEFGMGSDNSRSCFGKALNPWIRKDGVRVVPGGSSGASAAVVASGVSLGSLGTDTGGSVRQPAAFNGVVGFKPSYGRCSRYGVISLASSLDQAGVFANNIEDVALLFAAIAGYDAKDSTTIDIPVSGDISKDFNAIDSKKLRIGIPQECINGDLHPEILKNWKIAQRWCADAGCEIKPISLPNIHHGIYAYHLIVASEASSNLARYDGVRYGLRSCEISDNLENMYAHSRGRGLGREVIRRILVGNFTLSSSSEGNLHEKAACVRRLLYNDFKRSFLDVDAILMPVTNGVAFPIGEEMTAIDMYQNDMFTVPPSLAGLPALSLPVGLSEREKLPLGLQVVGNNFDEITVLKVGKIIESYANFTHKPKI